MLKEILKFYFRTISIHNRTVAQLGLQCLTPLSTIVQLQGPGGSMSQVVGLPNSNNSYKPITNMAWVRAQLCKLQPQVLKFTSCLPMVGGSPASSNTKTGCHDIAEILLKVALNTKNHQSSSVILWLSVVFKYLEKTTDLTNFIT